MVTKNRVSYNNLFQPISLRVDDTGEKYHV